MTSMPTGDAVALESPLTASAGTPLGAPGAAPENIPVDPELAARLARSGLATVLAEMTAEPYARLITHLADPMATDSRAAYAAWLRRQVNAWHELRLPAVPLAAVGWPLSSVRPQCLDVVGLLMADLRELSPRMRPTTIPWQYYGGDLPQPGVIVASVDLCVRLATPAARLLEPAQALTSGLTQVGSSTRYLTRCTQLAERAEGLSRELDVWGATAGPLQAQLAALTAQRLAERLASALDARVRTGW